MQVPRFSLRQLAYFVAVAESGSIRAACDRLNVSHAALAAAMEDLERALGAPLLIRQRARGVSLTPAGADLLLKARPILHAAEDLPAAVAGVQTRLSGRLSIGCYTTLAPFLVPQLFSGFKAQHPEIDLELIEGSTTEIAALLRNGRCETALLYAFGLDEDLVCEQLYPVAPHVVLAAHHPLAAQPCIDLRDLAQECLIVFDVAPASANTQDVFSHLGLKPRIGYRTSNFELARGLAARGLGYAVLLQKPAAELSYDGSALITRPLQGYQRPLHVVTAYARATPPTQRALAFRAYCRQMAAGLPSAPSHD